MLRIYQLLILILLPVVVLRLIYRSIREPAYRAHLVERFGWVGDYPTHDVWIHAVISPLHHECFDERLATRLVHNIEWDLSTEDSLIGVADLCDDA